MILDNFLLDSYSQLPNIYRVGDQTLLAHCRLYFYKLYEV